ncbi:MAG TPA: hypothetical protein HA263_10395 [Methanoregulaceae archaeon]|nr:hypothetical protein [Methanoregulaceae archaeon]
MSGDYLLAPYIDGNADLALLEGRPVELARLDVLWSRDHAEVRYWMPLLPDPPFAELLSQTASSLLNDGLADLAPILTAEARASPGTPLHLFRICYAVSVDDQGRYSYRAAPLMRPSLAEAFDGKLAAVATAIVDATIGMGAADIEQMARQFQTAPQTGQRGRGG